MTKQIIRQNLREDSMRCKQVSSFLLSTAVGILIAGSASAQVTVFEGARMIVGDGRVVDNATLVVDGARIVQAGAGVQAPAGATRVNLAGKTVMPMIIDTHVHLSSTREKVIVDLKRRAYFGVSAALSMGTDNLDLLPMRSENIPGAARFLSAGRGITRPEPLRPTYQINSDEEGRKAVQENAARKVDIIKFWVDDREGKVQKITPSQYAAIIDESKKQGILSSAHIFNMDDAKGLMRAGLDVFAHGVRDKDVDQETVDMFKARPNIQLIPNLPDRGVKVDRSWLKPGLPADEFAKLEEDNTDRPKVQEFHGIQARNLAKMNAAGVRITMGTDGNRAWGPHEEMEDMVLAGMTPAQVLVSATRNGAALLKINDAGTLEAGKSADFIVLDANPIDDIKNTRKISAVYLRGAAVDRSKPIQ
jgi:imidazolonepropionase-like amidohydrolase